ncbi:early nodulin-20-like [Micropterus salmoides]|uniref:early nodulin-20-like n=1 Tax=Micropterus salmoides TaxID=27706 RepID=UPI0018ED8487|nr:early nodulin-20-like [Micropterus salmoides]XP_038585244.1 early nodulin-20-like [Micropterus salmoides]
MNRSTHLRAPLRQLGSPPYPLPSDLFHGVLPAPPRASLLPRSPAPLAPLSQSPRFPVLVFPRRPPLPHLHSLNPVSPSIKPVLPQSCVWVHSVPTPHRNRKNPKSII